MKNLNKVLAMLVVFMMVVSTVAFAAFTDVAETSSYATAIDVDVDLGIIKGYDDNTFRPEGEITRAEFAAIVVRLLGQEAQSAGAAASTQFADVPASHWAAGYINIAVQAGVINGYGNGNFGPDDLVAYQDALTMMVRALGYEPAIGSAGYPTGYLTKAGDLGLTKNVNGTNGVPANRGTIAQIAFNSLDVPLMTQSGYGTFTQYVINDGYSSTSGNTNVKKTLLSENHSTVKIQGTILSSTDISSTSTTGTDKVEVKVLNDLDNKFSAIDTGDIINMEVGASDALAYVGKKCILFVEYDEFNDVCTVKALYEVVSNDSIVLDLADIEKYTATSVETEDANYSIDAKAKVYYNGVLTSKLADKVYPGDEALLAMSGTMELALLDATNATTDYDTVYITAYDVVVVDEVRAGASRVNVKTASRPILNKIFYDESKGDTKATLLDANSKVMDWADLDENDVVIVKYVAAKDGKTIYEAQVANNTVEGTVTEVDASANWGKDSQKPSDYKYVWIDGTEYKVLACAEADKVINVGDEGTYYVTDSGIVWHEATISVNNNYAYVISGQNEKDMEGAKVRMVTADGIATYDVASKIYVTDMYGEEYKRSQNKRAVSVDKDGNAVDFDLTSLKGTLITFKTDANGTVTAIEKALDVEGTSYEAEDYFTVHKSVVDLTGFDPDDNTFGKYTIDENTVIFDVSATDKNGKAEPSEYEVVAIKNLAEDDFLKAVTVYNIDDEDYIGAIVVDASSTFSISGSTNAATFVTGSSEAYDEEGVLVEYVKGYLNGEAVTYVCETGMAPAVGTLVIPEYKANGDVKKFNTVANGKVGNNAKCVGVNATTVAGANVITQDSSKGRIVIDGKTYKIPASANVYVYDSTSTARVKYTTDAYIGAVEYDDDYKFWYVEKDYETKVDVEVTIYEFDGDIVDVVYYVYAK